MNKKKLYAEMAERKFKPKDMQPYDGNNGRVNKCVELFKHGHLRTGGSLLDVGGGIGDLGWAVRDLGLFDRTVVIDISEKNLRAAAAKGNETHEADIDERGIPIILGKETFDVVVALDFIEHIIDPENFARQCYKVLKPGGHVFVNTPNIRFWRHIQQLWIDGHFPHTSGDKEVWHGGHLGFFTYYDLCNVFANAGFQSCKKFKDEEGYAEPPQWMLNPLKVANQEHYVDLMLEFGCPNLLFKCEKP